MLKKIVKNIIKGLSKDNAPYDQPEGTVFESHNGSIISRGGGLYSWRNANSSKKLDVSYTGRHPMGFSNIIGMKEINEQKITYRWVGISGVAAYIYNPVILFGLSDEETPRSMIALTSRQDGYDHINILILLIDDDLNFSKDYPIRDIHIEKEDITSIKVYFNDANNPPRVIELLQELDLDTFNANGYVFNIKAKFLDFNPSLDTAQKYVIHNRYQRYKAGYLYCRTYFVTYRLVFKNGSSTPWSPMIEKTVIPKDFGYYNTYLHWAPRHTQHTYGDLGGGSYNEESEYNLSLKIEGMPEYEKTLEVAVFDSINENSYNTGRLIIREDLEASETSKSYTGTDAYKGSRNLGAISLETVMTNSRPIRKADTMTYIDNMLTVGSWEDDFSIILGDTIKLREWSGVTIEPETYDLPFNDENPGYDQPDDDDYAGYTNTFRIQGLKGGMDKRFAGDFIPKDDESYDKRRTRWFGTWHKKDNGDYVKPMIATEESCGDMKPELRIKKFKNQTTGNTEYKNIELDLRADLTADYKNRVVASIMKGYWRDEWYRFGIIPWKDGISLGVRWIGDKKMPSIRSKRLLKRLYRTLISGHYEYGTDGSGRARATNKWLMKVLSVVINNIDITDLVTEDEAGNPVSCLIDGFSIVRAPREENILSEGIVMPAFNYKQGGTGLASRFRSDGDETYGSDDDTVFKFGLADYWRSDYQRDDFRGGYFGDLPSSVTGAGESKRMKKSLLYVTPENMYDYQGSGRMVEKNDVLKTETILREKDTFNDDMDTWKFNWYHYKYQNYKNHVYTYNPTMDFSEKDMLIPTNRWRRSLCSSTYFKYGNTSDGALPKYTIYSSQMYSEGIWGTEVDPGKTTEVKNVYQIPDGLGKTYITETGEFFYNKTSVTIDPGTLTYFNGRVEKDRRYAVNVGEGCKKQLIVTDNENLNVKTVYDPRGVQYISHRKRATNNNPYDGSDEGKKNTNYILCGHYQEITTDVLGKIKKDNGRYVFDDVQVFGGDTFLVPMNYARIKPSVFDANKMSFYSKNTEWSDWKRGGEEYLGTKYMGSNLLHAVSFPVQSKVNTLLSHGNSISKDGFRPYKDNIGTYYDNNITYNRQGNNDYFLVDDSCKLTKREEFNYNDAYSTDHITNFYLPLQTDVTENLKHIYDFAYTNQKISGETEDSFRMFPVNNIKQTLRDLGKIQKLISEKKKLFMIQKNGISMTYSEKEALTSQENNETLSLGSTTSPFHRIIEISNVVSMYDYFGATKGNSGIYIIDRKNKDIVIIENFENLKSLTLELGMHREIEDNIFSISENENMNKITEYGNSMIATIHNTVDDEMYFIIKDTDYNVKKLYRYNEKLGIFNGTYPADRVTGLSAFDSSFLMVAKDGSDNHVHAIGEGDDKHNFLGKRENARLTFIINDDINIDKIFAIMEIVGNYNMFSKIKIESKEGDIEENLVSLGNKVTSKNWRYYNDMWHGSYPVHSTGRRVTGNYIKVTLIVDGNRNDIVELSKFITGYRQNF